MRESAVAGKMAASDEPSGAPAVAPATRPLAPEETPAKNQARRAKQAQPAGVLAHKDEGWAADSFLHTEPAGDPLREARLARAQLSLQQQNVACLQQRA